MITKSYVITFSIFNRQLCCEEWGFFSSEEDLEDMIGANIEKIEVTDKAMAKTELLLPECRDDIEDVIFLDVVTNRGTFQFTAYTYHNGYYGHAVSITVNNKSIL